jgi:hypothetical protein
MENQVENQNEEMKTFDVVFWSGEKNQANEFICQEDSEQSITFQKDNEDEELYDLVITFKDTETGELKTEIVTPRTYLIIDDETMTMHALSESEFLDLVKEEGVSFSKPGE